MRTLMLAAALFAAGLVRADRTANRGWVERNFAPSNLVARVEALETGGGNEADPVFATWRDGSTVALGKGSKVISSASVQLGSGTNDWPGTLQFRTYQLVDKNGNIPQERLKYAVPANPRDGYDYYACIDGGILVFTPDSGDDPACGLEQTAIWNSCLRADEEGLFFRHYGTETLIVGTDGKIDEDCLPEIHTVEHDPTFGMWRGNESIAAGANAVAMASGSVQLCVGTNSTPRTLQFRNWRIVGADGKIPLDRLPVAELKAALGIE